MLIHKEYENKLILDSTFARNAHLNAIQNSKRKKSAKFIELHKKKQAKADKEYNEDAMSTILDVEEKEGKSWVDKIYALNGRKRPRKKGE